MSDGPVLDRVSLFQNGLTTPGMRLDAVSQHRVGKRFDDAETVNPPRHPDRKTFPGELVDQCKQTNLPAVRSTARLIFRWPIIRSMRLRSR